ncbi:hypothetical protein BR93DRAFT_311417 [Coniochaeta sp. PMI_546]|nr:hypothetical protein BR93DRAFT_311417 [Coniochaeta sp. PMI_546]
MEQTQHLSTACRGATSNNKASKTSRKQVCGETGCLPQSSAVFVAELPADVMFTADRTESWKRGKTVTWMMNGGVQRCAGRAMTGLDSFWVPLRLLLDLGKAALVFRPNKWERTCQERRRVVYTLTRSGIASRVPDASDGAKSGGRGIIKWEGRKEQGVQEGAPCQNFL